MIHCYVVLFLLRIRRPPRSTRTDTLFPYTTLFRSLSIGQLRAVDAFPLRRDHPREVAIGDAERDRIPGVNLHQRLLPMARQAGAEAGPGHGVPVIAVTPGRSEERRVGKGCVSTCRSRGSPDHSKKKKKERKKRLKQKKKIV